MSAPVLASLIFIIGLIGLVWSSHYFVGGSASLAKHLGMAPGLIGLTVVAFGTSAPEILVSGGAALEGAPDLGVGNAIGSNIANIGLVLGATALVAKLPVSHWLMRLEVPLLIIATALAAWILFDHQLTRNEGWILLGVAALLPVALLFDLKFHKTGRADDDKYPVEDEEIPDLSLKKSIIWLCGGLMILLLSADLLVGAATTLAEYFGVSPMIIGLTVVALGTSLPELAASIASAVKGHHEMAVGNVIGSNILNILLVMAMPALIMPSDLDAQVFSRDTMTMILLTVILLALIYTKTRGPSRSGYIGRPIACLFLLIYAGYYAMLIAGNSL